MTSSFFFRCCAVCLMMAGTEAGAQTFTTNLPILKITTPSEIPDDPKITGNLKIIDHGPGNTNSPVDTDYAFDGIIGIELRGSSSQGFPKKPYGFETRDVSGEGIDVSLLGMPKKDDWVLNATYNDKSLIRDVLAYKLGRDQGRYATRTRYCELYVNDEYVGIYALMEKIKRDKNRVNIPKIEESAVSGDALTGGYIIKIDKTTDSNGDGWYSILPAEGRQFYFQYEYPKPEDITELQRQYIQKYTRDFENTMNGENYRDPVNGYAKYIDIPSMIDFLIMNEVTKNVDGYRLSTFMYKKRDSDGGKLFMGPIWDFNLGFGNADYCTNGNIEGFAYDFNDVCPDDGFQVPFWWNRVLNDSTFKRGLGARWAELRSTVFQTNTILTYIDSVQTVLKANGAVTRNFQTWNILGQYVWPNYYVGNSYQDEVSWLKGWVSDRMNWLDQHIPTVISGVHDSPQDFTLSVYPNPFQHDLTVELSVRKPGNVLIEIRDLMGRKLQEQNHSLAAPGTYPISVTVPQSGSGVYFIKAVYGNSVRFEKMVKTN